VARFTDSISAQLESAELATFRRLIDNYATENDVPLVDVAAALAVISQAGKSFLLPPDPAPAARKPKNQPEPRDRPPASRSSTPRSSAPRAGTPRVAGPRRPRGDAPLATYRISVGRRHKVQPGAIVGAIANEGGLGRADFGQIDIQADHTLVELPANLPRETVQALLSTRISGKLIRLTKTDNPAPKRLRR
jgi:ATP-dependent RNA helicase DeaD